MNATAQLQDVTAHNLSHAVKPGYLREMVRFDSSNSLMQGPSASSQTDFSAGTMQFTGNKLDLALKGPGFFTIQGPAGPMYTRNGVFQLDAAGQLVTMEGLPALGPSGPISLPADTLNIEVQMDGTIITDGVEADQLRIVAFTDPSVLQRVGTSYFQPSAGAPVAPTAGEVFQGYRELSNSTVVQEMVQMIAGVRHFEAAQRALRSIADTIAFNTRPLNR